VRDGSVTVAVRDSVVDGEKVPAGAVIGVIDGKVAVQGDAMDEVLARLAAKIVMPEHEIISLYYGAGIDRQEAERMAAKINKIYADKEFELYEGGQPHYHFLLSAE
ncbi:MAG: DAK2 domain-containing protein, partial [Negativicutes bacterium]|nr:DAK2 domain-containing protein [Negativicutes bacterium]